LALFPQAPENSIGVISIHGDIHKSQGAASAVYTNEDKSSPSFILKTVFNEEQGKKCIVLQVEAVIYP
jgi:hypothetical protein